MNGFRMDKSFFEVVPLDARPDQTAYWQTRPHDERLAAMEMLRMMAFDGYGPTSRLERLLEVVEQERG